MNAEQPAIACVGDTEATAVLAATVPVRLSVWGVTNADREYAIYRASSSDARTAWRFVETERLSDTRCPIDLNDTATIATDCGYHWAYAAYPAERAP